MTEHGENFFSTAKFVLDFRFSLICFFFLIYLRLFLITPLAGRSIFQDMVSMDMLIMKIMNFAQRLVDADRASLFLVDSKNKELYATIFDVGIENKHAGDNTESESEESVKAHTSREIRFPLGTGIAGQVAMTGEVLNITDAYSDERFNRTVDQLTGYRTQTILCMPIYIRGSIIGVVQMVNKHTGKCFRVLRFIFAFKAIGNKEGVRKILYQVKEHAMLNLLW